MTIATQLRGILSTAKSIPFHLNSQGFKQSASALNLLINGDF